MAEFPTTRWSLVLALKGADALRCSEALGALCEAYWYPLYAFARRRGHPHDEASDLTQAFFLQLIEKDSLQHADAALGRLRAFLLTSFKNFLANIHDHGRALKRGGRWLRVELDPAVLADRYDRVQPDACDPERMYERQWARTVLARAMDALKAQEAARGRSREFAQLSALLTGEAPQYGYRHAAAALGKSEGAVRVELHRLRKRFTTRLRQEVAATGRPPAMSTRSSARSSRCWREADVRRGWDPGGWRAGRRSAQRSGIADDLPPLRHTPAR